MMRHVARWCFLGVMVCTASPAAAQLSMRPPLQPGGGTVESHGELHGVIEDDKGRPLVGAVVSAVGSATSFAVSDRDGRFAFRNLTSGAYLLRAHLQGYQPARGRLVQVTPGSRSPHTLSLARSSDAAEPPAVLTAGLGGADASTPPPEDDAHQHDEVAWRLRHLKRSILKEAEHTIAERQGDDSLLEDSLEGVGRAMGSSARIAAALFSDVSLNGHINLLTTTSFDRPQDLFAAGAGAPQGVAFLSLTAPGPKGDWLMRGTMTQGEVSSWIVAGSYRRSPDAPHAYEAGLSYSMQRYLGGNGEALLAIREGSRNVGAIYAYDDWAVASRVRLGYGARYARYDYLPDGNLVSPRASVTIQPSARDSLMLRAAVSHRETAPGAEEFTPPAVGLWLPPERTFSQISRAPFRPEQLDHVELAAEREGPGDIVLGVRAFRQRVDDQVVTLFGLAVSESHAAGGHYHVGSAGNFEARGWSVSASRTVGTGVRASVDYTQFDSTWHGASPDADALARLARSVLRKGERIHDVTASLDTEIAPTATRFFILYKLNTGFADANDTTPSPLRNVRFNVQVNQSLPFLNLMSGNWEMLVAVSNLFRDDVLDGSVYDELFVVEPPKRVLGGVTMRF